MKLLSWTHRLIGESVLKNIEASYNIKLDRDAFLYGCIKPDFNFGLIVIPHYKDKSFDFILSLIDKLKSTPFPRKRET